VQFPIHIELHRSRLLVFFLLLFHALAVVSVLVLPWSWLLRSVLLGVIGVSAWHALRKPKILGVRLSAQGGLDCLFAGDVRSAASLLPDSTVFNQLIILRLRIGDARGAINLALLPGSMSAEQFRVLRLWLRWRNDSSESAGRAF